MPFTGFPAEAFEFYAGLEADNSKAYWSDHKSTYDRAVAGPMRDLLAALEPEFGRAKHFRPNRDVRFSADKSPYKTHAGALAGEPPWLGCYLHIGADGIAVRGGFHARSSADTARLREAIDDDRLGAELAGIVATLEGQGFAIISEGLRTAPRGYPKDHPRIELLRIKDVMVLDELGEPDWVHTERAATVIAARWREVRRLVDWVEEHVG